MREAAETAWKRFGPGVRATVLAMPELLQRNNAKATQKAAAAISKQGLQAVPAMIDVLSLEHTTVISSGIFVTPVPTVGNLFPPIQFLATITGSRPTPGSAPSPSRPSASWAPR